MRPARIILALVLLGAVAAPARDTAPAPELGGRSLILNGEATRSVWGFDVYQVRLYLTEIMRKAEQIFAATTDPKRLEIVMKRTVEEEQFASTVQENVDNNFTAEEKQKFAPQLGEFLGCFNNGADLKPGNVITIDYVPAEGTVVKLDGRTLDTIPGADFYHALLRLWIGKPLQKSIREGLVGEAG